MLTGKAVKNKVMNENDLLAKGFVRGPDGVWLKPHRPVGAVEADSAKPTPVPPLESRAQKRPRSKGSLAARVSIIAMRHRLLDPDAVAFACKPCTDSIAKSLGVDDADPRIEWEWSQVKTAGEEGVIVKIEELS